MRIFKSHPLLSLVNGYLVDSPQPSNLSYLWNFGSLLQASLMRAYTSSGWCLNSPPKPHAFASLPLQSTVLVLPTFVTFCIPCISMPSIPFYSLTSNNIGFFPPLPSLDTIFAFLTSNFNLIVKAINNMPMQVNVDTSKAFSYTYNPVICLKSIFLGNIDIIYNSPAIGKFLIFQANLSKALYPRTSYDIVSQDIVSLHNFFLFLLLFYLIVRLLGWFFPHFYVIPGISHLMYIILAIYDLIAMFMIIYMLVNFNYTSPFLTMQLNIPGSELLTGQLRFINVNIYLLMLFMFWMIFVFNALFMYWMMHPIPINVPANIRITTIIRIAAPFLLLYLILLLCSTM